MKQTSTFQPVLSATTLIGDSVVNAAGEDLGKIEDFILDLPNGRIRYAVVSFGGFIGMGEKLFAVPCDALKVDTKNHSLVLDIAKKRLESAPGFDKDSLPDTSVSGWQNEVYKFYGITPYWR